MANETVSDARTIKGFNPQHFIEKIIRSRIYDSLYWKEECFALTTELLIDKAMNLKSVGGTFGSNVKPTEFICLLLKLLQIQPEKDIIIEFIKNDDFKYLRSLGALYIRLVGTAVECYNYLEPLYGDFRKLRCIDCYGKQSVMYMDVFIEKLLNDERIFDIVLPHIQQRHVLEELNLLKPRQCLLNLDELDDEEKEILNSKPIILTENEIIDEKTEKKYINPLKKKLKMEAKEMKNKHSTENDIEKVSKNNERPKE